MQAIFFFVFGKLRTACDTELRSIKSEFGENGGFSEIVFQRIMTV